MAHRLTRVAAVTGSFFLALTLAPAAAGATTGATAAPVASAAFSAPTVTAAVAPVLKVGGASLDTARVKVNYPTRQSAYQPISYTYTVWKSYVFEGQVLVLYTDINRGNVSKIRITRRAPNAKCGVRKEGRDYNAYCIITRPEKWKRFTMTVKVWPRRLSSVIADHYWGGGDYGVSTDSIAQADKFARTRTRLLY